MHIKKLKVRPRKQGQYKPCLEPLSAMLGCWAANGDLNNTGMCMEASKALFECMRTTPMPVKRHGPTINYHLARLGKNLK